MNLRGKLTGPRIVLGALLVFYVVLFFRYQPQFPDQHPGDGSYRPIRARGDGHYYYVYTLSLCLDGDLDQSNQLRTIGDPWHILGMRNPVTGQLYMRPIGSSLMQAPAFLVAHGAAWVANLFGAGIAMHGYTPWHQGVTFLGNLLAGWLALLFAYRLARRHVSPVGALYGLIVVGAGSGVLFYASYWASYNHTWSLLWCAWLLEYWDRTRGRFDLRRWAGLGALAGLVTLVRQQDAIFVAIPAAEWLLEAFRRAGRRDGRGLAQLAAGGALESILALVIVFPQLYVFKHFFGAYLAPADGDQRLRPAAPYFWEVLFSSRAGLFAWTPLMYLGAIGLLLGIRRAWPLLCYFVLGVYATAATWNWEGAWSYGMRRALPVVIVLVAGVGFVVDALRRLHARWPRLAPHAALALCLLPFILINVEMSKAVSRFERPVGKAQDGTGRYLLSLNGMVDSVQQTLGNPFSWPASWIWAARHRVSPGRYDRIVGQERLYVEPTDYRRPGKVTRDAISFERPLGDLDAGGWSAVEQVDGRRALWIMDRARMLLPLFVDEDVELVLSLDGTTALEVDLEGWQTTLPPTTGWTEVTLRVPPGVLRVGTNELVLSCGAPRCAAVNRLVLVYDPQ